MSDDDSNADGTATDTTAFDRTRVAEDDGDAGASGGGEFEDEDEEGEGEEEGEPAPAELAAQLELLAEENRRLRTEYARVRRSRYRNTALGLAAIGLVAALGGLLVPDGREVLFGLAATGLFGGVLTATLSPGRFVAADVGERVYAATATNEAALVDELGLRDERIYVPAAGSIRLFVPQRAEYELPDAATGPIVTDDATRGLLLETTGGALFGEFERAVTDGLAGIPEPLASQLADGLVEQFELARSATVDVDRETGRATTAITDSAFGDVDRFDHPIASFLAVGFASGLERPIELEVVPADDRADWLVTCRWALDGENASEGEGERERENVSVRLSASENEPEDEDEREERERER